MAAKTSQKSAKVAESRDAATESPGWFSASSKIEEMIADLGDWRGEWLAEIRRLIHEVDPEVIEDWKWRGTPVWSNEGMYANANAFKEKVKLTFFHGIQLSELNNPYQGRPGREQVAGDRHP